MKQRWVLAAVLALAALAYWPGLAGPLVLDDHANLDPLVQWLHGELGWRVVVFGNGSGLLGRPVSMLSFLANAATTGESVFAFKLTNLAVHLANGVALFAFLTLLVRRQAPAAGASPAAIRWLPVLATACWLLHPLLVSTVLYVVQRMAMLAAFFVLLSLVSYLRGRIALEWGRRGEAVLLLGCVVPACVVLAVLSKEVGALAPALCGVVEWLVFVPVAGRRRHPASTVFVLFVLLVPAVVAIALTAMGDPRITGGYVNRPFTLAERLLTQPRALWDYVGAWLLPYGPRLGLYHDDFQVSRSLLSPATTLVATAGWLLMLVAAWRLRRTIPALALGVAIFLVGQALESTVFPLLMYFEHRVYLPSIGLAWALLGLIAYLLPKLERHMHHGPRVFACAATGLVLVLGLATTARALVWRSQASILAQALAHHPDSRWARMDAIAFDMAQQPPAMASAFAHAQYLATLPSSVDRRFGELMVLSLTCLTDGTITPRLQNGVFGGTVDSIEPDLLVGYESLSARVTRHPCAGLGPGQMAGALAGMLDRSPLPKGHRSVWRLRFQAARLYWIAGEPEPALREARLALAARSAEAPVPLFLAAMLIERGDREGAARALRDARARLRPGDEAGLRLLSRYEAKLARPPG
jgi:hypothetical protein